MNRYEKLTAVQGMLIVAMVIFFLGVMLGYHIAEVHAQQVPKQPDDLTIEIFEEATLCTLRWEFVTHDIYGEPICISRYNLYGSIHPNAVFCVVGITLDQFNWIRYEPNLNYSDDWYFYVTASEGG